MHAHRKTPTEIDLTIGRNLRRQRIARGKSQETLAIEVGISAQQIQKYETAINRVSASRLLQISLILGVQIADFFIGQPDSRDNLFEPVRASSFLQSEK